MSRDTDICFTLFFNIQLSPPGQRRPDGEKRREVDGDVRGAKAVRQVSTELKMGARQDKDNDRKQGYTTLLESRLPLARLLEYGCDDNAAEMIC